jgi:hypothetical protein
MNKANSNKLTRAERLLLRAMMNLKNKKNNPNPKFLTEAHKKNSEAAIKQIAEWKETPSTLEEILEKQRKRDQQAKS